MKMYKRFKVIKRGIKGRTKRECENANIVMPWMVALRSINGLELDLLAHTSKLVRPVPDLQSTLLNIYPEHRCGGSVGL